MSAASRSFGWAVLALWLAVYALPSGAAVAQSAQFKGWSAVWRELSARIAPRDAPLDIDRFLPAEDMEDLLGTWSTFGSEHHFRNGFPNSLSMMIWQVAMTGFADAMGRSCTHPELTFDPSFQATLDKACAWPEAKARADETLVSFWQAIMGFNAPETEYLAWRDFLRRDFADKPAPEVVRAMTLTITLHPNFLLQR